MAPNAFVIKAPKTKQGIHHYQVNYRFHFCEIMTSKGHMRWRG